MSIFTLTIKGVTCDIALHPISKRTEERIVKSCEWPRECFKFWKHGKTSHFGIRKDGIESIVACLDDKCVNIDFEKIKTNNITNSIMHYNIPMVMFGFADEMATCKFVWNNVKKFDVKKLVLNIIDWKTVNENTGFISIDNIFYDNRQYSSFDWENPSGFHLIEPNVLRFAENF